MASVRRISAACQTLEEALHCAKCKNEASFVEECTDPAFAPGEIVLIQCGSCREKPSFYCKSCKKKCYLTGLAAHAKRKRHQQLHLSAYPPQPEAPPDPPAIKEGNYDQVFDVPMEPVKENELDDLDMASDDFCKEMEAAMEKESFNSNDESVISALNVVTRDAKTTMSEFPKINLEGNEWLAVALSDTPRATLQEMIAVFSAPGMESMKNFWTAELASGDGHCGGGIVYLSARAFQQGNDAQLDSNKYPSFTESVWQFQNLVQYQSMSEKQRARQSMINTSLVGNLPSDSLFLRNTSIPPQQQLGRYYGGSGQHSMWNNLPCPKVIDVDGVAYVSPRCIIAYVMANGIPIDDIQVNKNSTVPGTVHHSTAVNYACESRKGVNWLNSVKRGYYSGAPDLNEGAPKFPVVIGLGVSDWTDGFGPGKVKNNRNSVDCKSFTVSPPKHLVNATHNTFAVAMGLKKAKGWEKVERLFREDIESLCDANQPTLFYHGRLQKMIPCVFKRFVVMSDKAERNGLTGTIGCGSDMHRCFGISGKINTPSCKLDELTTFFSREQDGSGKGIGVFGWSDKFVIGGKTTNGAVLPSCKSCRRAGIEKLGIQVGRGRNNVNASACGKCCNWDLLPNQPQQSSLLDFPVHKDYPTSYTEGCPVDPPKGRNRFEEEIKLPFIQLEWETMKLACKFSFFQASRPRKSWTKATTTAYLRCCGVSNALAARLYDLAKECVKAKLQDSVNYNEADRIGEFEFPAPWLSKEITLRDYVEAIMHQLFLGIAESNYDLIQTWLSGAPAASKLGYAPFQNILQRLIKDLRPFMLSWLPAYPLTGKKGSLGTGSWVAENWVCLVRLSQFVFGWCISQRQASSRFGVDDMSRMVIAFHCLVARCLTHGAIDDNHIKETELYMKEFLSAVREFDIRVRHKALNSQTGKKGTTEAWWLKPNYMSLSNLLAMMYLLGPLVEYWDGGGKGERFIQVVKPHIKRGVREDAKSFFVNLLDKLYKTMQLELLEKLYGIFCNKSDDHASFMEVLQEVAIMLSDELEWNNTTRPAAESDDEADEESISGGDNTEVSVDETSDTAKNRNYVPGHEAQLREAIANAKPIGGDADTSFSLKQSLGMAKKKTIYVYRNEEQLREAIANTKPLAGYVNVVTRDNKTAFEFEMACRKPVKQFARHSVTFDDKSGIMFHGLWCAKIQIDDANVRLCDSFGSILKDAKLAAVAIPLWYVVGRDHPHGASYCVITNWWKYRMSDGCYRLPTLDPSLYGGKFQTDNEPRVNDDDAIFKLPSVTTTVVNGVELGEL